MSPAGPRPNPSFVVDQDRKHYERILRVKPGITGLVAVRRRMGHRPFTPDEPEKQTAAVQRRRTRQRRRSAGGPAVSRSR